MVCCEVAVVDLDNMAGMELRHCVCLERRPWEIIVGLLSCVFRSQLRFQALGCREATVAVVVRHRGWLRAYYDAGVQRSHDAAVM
jgi:hypothetical protein